MPLTCHPLNRSEGAPWRKREGADPVRDRPPRHNEASDDHGVTWIVSRWINAPGPGKPADWLMVGELLGTQ